MGQCCPGGQSEVEQQPLKTEPVKTYSWDKRERSDAKDFTVVKLDSSVVAKRPGSINGQSFKIEDCKNSSVLLYDNIASITVDDCQNCSIFIGPTKGSVFIRNCTNCRFIIACQQFRTRDCKNLDVLLSCKTIPIIEATSAISFGCFRGSYFALGGQFSAADLSVYNNNWGKIHDFTPLVGQENHSFASTDPTWLATFFTPSPTNNEAHFEVDLDPTKYVVPLTYSAVQAQQKKAESLFIAFFEPAAKNAKKFLKLQQESHPQISIIKAGEMTIAGSDLIRIFGAAVQTSTGTALPSGVVVGFEIDGTACGFTTKSTLRSAIESVLSGMNGALACIPTENQVRDAFFQHNSSAMAV